MTNSSREYLQGLIGAVITDCVIRVPCLRKELERDHTRLNSAMEHRGLSFFTIDLPDAGKHFDKCLSDGRLTKFELPHMRPFKRGGVIPRLFKGLLLRVFQESGELRAHPDLLCIELLRMLFNFLKKLDMECSDDKTYRSVREFFEIEQAVRSGSLQWESDALDAERSSDLHFCDGLDPRNASHSSDDQFDLPGMEKALPIVDRGLIECFQQVADIVSSTLGRFNPSEWKAKHGPGAVSDLPGGADKYQFPYWPDKLEGRFPLSEFAFANYERWVDYLNGDEQGKRFSLHEPPARLIAVPKTQKGPRLIASEPTCHQWIQQLVRRFVIRAIADTPVSPSISLRDQGVNQCAAKAASLGSGHATVDLSSASDRLTCWTVERFFRRNPEFLLDIHACRTRWMVNTIDRRLPKHIVLKKFACQGSALTFPIQTLIYASAGVAAVLYARSVKPSLRTVRNVSRSVHVFGDDTVIPLDALDAYEGILEYLDFKVNHAKTYRNGKFRESCGTEWYDGHKVTPTYFRSIPQETRPESLISAVHVSNNLFKAGYKTASGLIQRTVQRLVPKNSVPFVAIGSGTFGWERPMADLGWKPRKRFCRDTQQVLVQVLGLKTGNTVTPIEGGSALLQYFTEEPDPDVVWKSGKRSRPKLNLRLRWERPHLLLGEVS